MNQPYRLIARPGIDEYLTDEPPYPDLLPADDLLLQHMEENFLSTRSLIIDLPEEKLSFRYAPGKWTIREMLMHLIDTERIMTYRALRFARNDSTELPGFDHLKFVGNSGADHRSPENMLDEFQAVRFSTIALFNGLDEEALLRKGRINKNSASVRGLAYHIAGHELHHRNLIHKYYI
ncbi:MAG TPA: DinB family protein [Puia sp.]|nr:DinB family protein [Puia sp.]